MDAVAVIRWLAEWVLPPGLQLLLAVAGLLLLRRARRLGVALLAAAGLSLAVLTLPAVAGWLMAGLQPFPALAADAPPPPGAEAIVVLSSGRMEEAPEYGGRDTADGLSLERLRYGVHLHRRTGLPLLISGGSGSDDGPPVARILARVAQEDFGVAVAWTETRSRNTWENARYTSELLATEGVSRILLVTHAWHMPRAMTAFRAGDLVPVAAPTMFVASGAGEPGDWLPSARALARSYLALHEYVGLLWYRLRYQ